VDVKASYKRTDFREVPEDWSVVRLGDEVTKVGSGITPGGGEKVYKQQGRPFIRSQNVGWGRLLLSDLAFIDDNTHRTFNDTEIQENDVLLNITGASIGRSAVADARVAKGNVNQHVCIIRTDKNRLAPQFLNYFLLSHRGQEQIDSFQAGGSREGLNFGQVRAIRLARPDLPEQLLIAQSLDDTDALIESLMRLIAKKHQIKKGVMQELLTAKRRLPGYSKEWKTTQLVNVAPLQRGFDLPNSEVREGSYPVVYSNGILNHHADFQVKGPGVVTGRSGTIGTVTFVEQDFWPHNTSLWVTDFKGNDRKFVFYLYTLIGLDRFAGSQRWRRRTGSHDSQQGLPEPAGRALPAIARPTLSYDSAGLGWGSPG
jgi:type I restriction enzyme, S subunit